MKPDPSMNTSPGKWLQALVGCLTNRARLPERLDEPPHPDATTKLERRLEREIARRLGRRNPGATS